jgi:ceramide glucosyltransferase
MFISIMSVFTVILYLLCAASIVYVLYARHCVKRFGRQVSAARMAKAAPTPAVSVLKPVCGLESGLYENLRSFCDQDYPDFQIVFAVRDAADPAIPVIARVRREFPELSTDLVVDPIVIGTNLKVSNLANVWPMVRHDLIVIADSDMCVGRDYLHTVTASFADPGVGAVTCLYRGAPQPGIASQLAALFINDWFLPSVLVAHSFSPIDYCFGATMAVRREALNAIGGFEALADYLADDYMLGQLVRQHGYAVRLCPYVVETRVHEPDLAHAYRHELRWARTVRAAQPVGFAFSFLTDAIPLSLITVIMSGLQPTAFALLAGAAAARTALHYTVRHAVGVTSAASPWLVPLRDVLRTFIWAMSFTGSRVQWRDQQFSVSTEGQLLAKGAELP